MQTQRVTVKELISYLPDEIFDDITQASNVDYQVKSLTGKDLFLILLYTHFQSKDESLRVVEAISKSKAYRAFAGKLDDYVVPHTTLSDRLRTMKIDFLQMLFQAYMSILKKQYSSEEYKAFQIMRYDSTFISLSAKLLHFGMNNGTNKKYGESAKHQIKFTVGFNGMIPTDVTMYKNQADISDDASFREIILTHSIDKKEISVFDRGCKTRKTFKEFWEKELLFITRITTNTKYLEVGSIGFSKNDQENTDKLNFKKDISVYLYDGNCRQCKIPLRLVIYTSKESGQDIYFLTNIYTFKASEIAEIYARRWDIEVFFKFLKQELNFKHFISRNENGVLATMYITLIAAIMLLIYKRMNAIKGYKIMKLQFQFDLQAEIMKIIVKLCGGDPGKVDNLPPNLGFGQ